MNRNTSFIFAKSFLQSTPKNIAASYYFDFHFQQFYLCVGFEFYRAFEQGGVVATFLVLPVQAVRQAGDVVQTNLVRTF